MVRAGRPLTLLKVPRVPRNDTAFGKPDFDRLPEVLRGRSGDRFHGP